MRASKRPGPPRGREQRDIDIGQCFSREDSVGIRSSKEGRIPQGGLFPCLTSLSRMYVLFLSASFPEVAQSHGVFSQTVTKLRMVGVGRPSPDSQSRREWRLSSSPYASSP